MDSSPELSLSRICRRESNGSRDSFYMDFAQGIDSDIEEIGSGGASLPKQLDMRVTHVGPGVSAEVQQQQNDSSPPTLPPIPSTLQEP